MSTLVIILGAYMLLMGLIGYWRTKSPTALYVNGGIAVVTIILGILLKGDTGTFSILTAAWVALVTIILSVMTCKRLVNRQNARPGSIFIFGSMALFSLIVLIVMVLRWLAK